jgi:hypothetical protein
MGLIHTFASVRSSGPSVQLLGYEGYICKNESPMEEPEQELGPKSARVMRWCIFIYAGRF